VKEDLFALIDEACELILARIQKGNTQNFPEMAFLYKTLGDY